MTIKFMRKYNEEAVLHFPLFQPDGVDLETSATFASGDVKITKDEGIQVNTTNLPVDEASGYALTLTATEMQAARIMIYIVDQTGTKVWLDEVLIIETYGHASAQHAFDLDDDDRTGSANTTTPPTAAAIRTEIDSNSTQLAAIVADTNELQTDDVPGLIAALNDLSAAAVNAEVDTALTDYDPPTKAELDAGLAALNDLSAAAVNAEVDTALADIHLDRLLAADYDPASKPGTATALLNELVENDSGISRFTANALEQAPSGGGTESHVLLSTTIATVTSQTEIILTAGSDNDNAYLNQTIVIYDVSNSDFPSVRRITSWNGSTLTAVLDAAPDFTMVASDTLKIFVAPTARPATAGSTQITNITVDDGVDPLEGAALWINTNNSNSAANVLWAGATNASGNPKDSAGVDPFLDAGTYYVWVQIGGYTAPNPSTYTVGTPLTISLTAVASPGSVTMQDLIDEIQNDLNDAAAATWSEALLLQWLNDAIRDYSLDFPRRRTGTITAVSGTHKYSLPEDHLETITVEYPPAQDPPSYLVLKPYTHEGFWTNNHYFDILINHDQDVDDELWISQDPTGGGNITIEYTAYHPHNLAIGEFTSVPTEHHHILKTFVLVKATEWLQMAEQVSPTSNSSLLMAILAQNAEQFRKLNKQLTQRSRRHRRSRRRGRSEEGEE